MLRSAITRTGITPRSYALRAFSSTAKALAVAPPPKKQAKVVRKREVKEKVKKGGMTHLKFGEAVRQLNFEKTATDLSKVGLPTLEAEKMAEIDSKVALYDPQTELQLRTLGLFKKNQHHELFLNPVSMVTENTREIQAEFVEKLTLKSADNRICLLGEKGAGKSTFLTQAQALALSHYKGDVVLLHLDHAERVVDGSSDYFLNPTTKTFHQPMFTKRWIKKVRAANEAVFKKMPLTEDVSFVTKKEKFTLKKEANTVFDFLEKNHEFGFFGPSNAFQFFVKQLQAHSETFPVFFSVDNFNALIHKPYTEYFHTDMTPVRLEELEFGAFVSQLVSGKLSFAKGGILLSESKDCGECKTLRVGLKLQSPNPYDTLEQCNLEMAEKMTLNGGVKALTVKNMTKAQAREFLTFLDNAGVLQVRQYPTKEIYKSLEEPAALPGRTMQVGEYIRLEDAELQFESILQLSFFASAGNPGRFLKINNMTF